MAFSHLFWVCAPVEDQMLYLVVASWVYPSMQVLEATMNSPKTETPGHQRLCAPSVWIAWKMEGAHKRCSRTLGTSLPSQLKHPKDSWCLHPKWEITESHLGVSPSEVSLSMAPSEERLDIKQCPGCMRDATGCPGLSLCGGHPWLSLSLAVRVSLCAFVNCVGCK